MRVRVTRVSLNELRVTKTMTTRASTTRGDKMDPYGPPQTGLEHVRM